MMESVKPTSEAFRSACVPRMSLRNDFCSGGSPSSPGCDEKVLWRCGFALSCYDDPAL